MPEDRDPLGAAEKKLLRKWIDGGAEWTIDQIDGQYGSRSRSIGFP